ncbi:hypothetical protein CDL15_Pgr011903 [Punica granatum]|uniref:Uncharacterized protein n=1 Tax=Punica granatum TaxID=22663 RepID=A0A218WC32_PUNGR|nr:hypothetical protein CDL15_Pgr011903 [Punica granatum]
MIGTEDRNSEVDGNWKDEMMGHVVAGEDRLGLKKRLTKGMWKGVLGRAGLARDVLIWDS